MTKIAEIKIALSASKLGPMYKADFDANAAEYIAYLLNDNAVLQQRLQELDEWTTEDYGENVKLVEENVRLRKEIEEAVQAMSEPHKNLWFKLTNERNRAEEARQQATELQRTLEKCKEAIGWYALGKPELARAVFLGQEGEGNQ